VFNGSLIHIIEKGKRGIVSKCCFFIGARFLVREMYAFWGIELVRAGKIYFGGVEK
jgi:hypothetical protein